MKKIFYFELDEEAIVRYSEEEILAEYLEKLSFEAITFIPVVSAYIKVVDYPLEECNAELLLLRNTNSDTYWIEEKNYLKYLEDANIVYELYNEQEMLVNVSLKYC